MNEQEIREAIKAKEQILQDSYAAAIAAKEDIRRLKEELEFMLYGLKPGMHVLNRGGIEFELIRFTGYRWDAKKIKKDGGLYAYDSLVWSDFVTIKPAEQQGTPA